MKTTDKGVPEQREEFHWFDPWAIEIFSNPRTLNNPGFQPIPMAELRQAIQFDGLKQALEVRMIDGKPRLIAGERRLRSIQGLHEEGAECFDRNTGKTGPANKVYATVKCIVTECADDKAAARASVLENLLHEHLTDHELLLQCDVLEQSGHSRSEQAKIFGKSEAWVSQSHSLLKGHPKVLEALTDGVLGRTQALQFLNYPPEKTENILARSIAYNKMDFSEKEKELLEHQSKVYESYEEHETQLAVAQEMGNTEEASAIRRQLSEDEKEADATDRKLKKHRAGSKRKPRPSINNIQKAAQDEDADGGANRHMPMKNVRRMADQLSALLLSGEPLINPETESEYNRREVCIVRDVLDCVLSRNTLKSPLDALNAPDAPVEVPAEDIEDALEVAAK